MNIETKKWEILCSEEQIASKLKELGAQISKDYEGKNLLVVSLLKGSFIFCADLVRNITVPVKIEFMTTSSYGHGEVNTGVKVVSDVNCDLEGYDVLIVDDITDTALTMHHVINHLKAKNPNIKFISFTPILFVYYCFSSVTLINSLNFSRALS
jgi:hypoxanthine phosphoribosyltransferase